MTFFLGQKEYVFGEEITDGEKLYIYPYKNVIIAL
jgi:hypothetical protein